ncbi:LOW QUALITY PROTEIN: probable S-adenosylmethionine-dependent methyltransferase At5g38100, partial [Jatropha curcas]|uniref:LOW QUALITY PROTEIN: probable S-adenosylmethionine-dependent methyltransferase At5g38100 n=1 Tax=Jatropha curcas TaxID=180498 RepID=UPI001894C4DF
NFKTPPLEFQVLFNDQTDNDFNTLFKLFKTLSFISKLFASWKCLFLKWPEREEVIGGAFNGYIITCRRDWYLLCFQTPAGLLYQLWGDSLRDMAKLGVISEEKVDTFNLPLYYSSPKELEEIIKRNGHFSIENLHVSGRPVKYDPETL